jgi:hypothetical protein
MSHMPPGIRTYIDNAAKASGKTEAHLLAVLSESGLKKHGELRAHAMEALGLGHGHANALAAYYLKPDWQTSAIKPAKAAAKAPPTKKPATASTTPATGPSAKMPSAKPPLGKKPTAKKPTTNKPTARKPLASRSAAKKKK